MPRRSVSASAVTQIHPAEIRVAAVVRVQSARARGANCVTGKPALRNSAEMRYRSHPCGHTAADESGLTVHSARTGKDQRWVLLTPPGTSSKVAIVFPSHLRRAMPSTSVGLARWRLPWVSGPVLLRCRWRSPTGTVRQGRAQPRMQARRGLHKQPLGPSRGRPPRWRARRGPTPPTSVRRRRRRSLHTGLRRAHPPRSRLPPPTTHLSSPPLHRRHAPLRRSPPRRVPAPMAPARQQPRSPGPWLRPPARRSEPTGATP